MRGIECVLVLSSICQLVSPGIISTPENVAILRGTSTELKCGVSSGSSVPSLTFTGFQSSSKDVTIYSLEIGLNNNVTSFRNITYNAGSVNIRSQSAQLQDAGVYTCNVLLKLDEGNRVEQRSAHLIVLDSHPSCTAIDYSNDDRKYKQLSCSIGFRGSWAPVMEWRNGGINGPIVGTGDQGNSSSNAVSRSLIIPVDDDKENAATYTCVTYFSAYMGNDNVTADNIPKYTYTYIWPVTDNLKDLEPTTKREYSDGGKLQLIELTGALAAVVGVLLLLLLIISTRNYKKYNRGSALVDEAHFINGGHVETRNKVEPVRHGIRNLAQPEAGECSRKGESVNFKFGSSCSASVDGKQAMNHVASDKRSFSYYAADGTEYMEMNSGQTNRPQMPVRNPSRYEQVLYASIDHTLKAPPPPRYV